MFRRKNQQSKDAEPSEHSASFRISRRKATKPSRVVDGRESIWSVGFSADGKHIMSGGAGNRIRRWQVKNGEAVMPIMYTGHTVHNIVASQDGKWVVSGTSHGMMVWNARTGERATTFHSQAEVVYAVDASLDGTRIVSGSEEGIVALWSLDPAQGLLSLLQHDYPVVGLRFSPDARLIAVATQWGHNSLCIYDSQDGGLLAVFPVRVSSLRNQSLAWASDSKHLFVLSSNGVIHCLDTSTGKTLSKWPIHTSCSPASIVLASNNSFIAASGEFSVSFWDTITHDQVGSLIQHPDIIESMDISANYEIAISGGQKITLCSLCDTLPSGYCDKADYRETRMSHRIQDGDPKEKLADLEKVTRELCDQLTACQHTADEEKRRFNDSIKSLNEKNKSLNNEVIHLEKTVQQLREELADAQHGAIGFQRILHVHEQKHHCEVLYAEGRVTDAMESLLEIVTDLSDDVKANKLIMDWLAEFKSRCASTLESIGDEASSNENCDEALAAYSTALSLSLSAPNTVLIKWAKAILVHNTANQALGAATKFQLRRFTVYQTICDILEGESRITEAVFCFRQMQRDPEIDTAFNDEQMEWEHGFLLRSTETLEKLGDARLNSGDYKEAANHFSLLLLLNPSDRVNVLIKRSKALASMNSWTEALNDADEAIELDPSCHRGYEVKHAALHGAKRFAEAAEAFRMMLLKLEEAPDECVRELRFRYVDATSAIRRIVEQTIRTLPRVLIDTTTGRLHDKIQQTRAFEALPIYSELVSSMTTKLDYAWIWREVKEFYRYVMLSHKWEHEEPLLQKVENISIYELEASLANTKLQTFCSLARSLGFRWAWSDTCCVDKLNNVVLQESLVAMFTWYRGSSLTIVYLRGISSQSQVSGALQKSIWNTRAWTYQEYVAAEVVQFYTEDWKPYLGLDMFNHKESPAVVLEMQHVAGSSVQDTAILRPGLDRVREKLHLASTRQTTLVEDIAYSLLGIFNAAIPVIYGEGDRAVGRFLEHILTGSGDVTILAWTGHSGSYNSCLPSDLTAYDPLVPPHVPQPIETAEMEAMVMALHSSQIDLTAASMLHDHLDKLPSPSFNASRLTLPGIVFPITSLDTLGSGPDISTCVYRATTSALGEVEINTADDLSGAKDLVLIHPWISPLLDQEFSHGKSALDDTLRGLRLVIRLRQSFGALLLEPVSRARYRRVASDGLVMVRVSEEMSLMELVEGIRTVDIQ